MILDHDPVRRARLADVLDRAPDLELAASASTAAITHVVLCRLGAARPDVMLVALDLPDGEAPGTVAAIQAGHPRMRVLTYAGNRAHPLSAQALAAGAGAVLTERTLLDDLRAVMGADPDRV